MTKDIETFHAWVSEAMEAHIGWQRDSWEDYEFRDGVHWRQEDANKLLEKGINPLTINRVFPVLNLIYGNYIRNQKDIIAKGRTKHDHELAQVASEGIQMVVDQNDGTAIQREAFQDSLVTGLGCVYTGFNSDPRRERVFLKQIPWYNVWWDKFSDPWLNTNNCRYVFTADWKDVEDVKMFFPEKSKEIDDAVAELSATTSHLSDDFFDDIGTHVETFKSFLAAGTWSAPERQRVRPIEMWYTNIEPTWFAIMPDDRVFELDDYDISDQFNIIQSSREVVHAQVKKMRVATFLGRLILQDVPSPFPHAKYPFTPFIGYLDRYGRPFGIPRQIKEQNMEVNKRRTMGLALLNSRRTFVEKGAVEDPNRTAEELARIDSFVEVNKGKMDGIQVNDLTDLAQAQISFMQQSEGEIQEIVGANDESLGYNTPPQSGVSLEKKRQFSSTVTLSLMENAFRSQKILGEKILSLIQSSWTEEKVLRVIDRLSGVEKFVEINKRIQTEAGTIEIQNDLTQARFDLVVTTKEITDTMRDKNLDLLFSAINKAPPEAVAPLLNVAFEISDIPEKERILAKIRMATGLPDDMEDLSTDERKQLMEERKNQQQAEAERQSANEQMQTEADRRKTEAEIAKLNAQAEAEALKANAEKQKVDQEAYFESQKLVNELLGEGV